MGIFSFIQQYLSTCECRALGVQAKRRLLALAELTGWQEGSVREMRVFLTNV